MSKTYALPEDESGGDLYQRILLLMDKDSGSRESVEDESGGDFYRRILLLLGKNWGSRESVVAAVSLLGGLLAIVLGVLGWGVVELLAPAGTVGSLLDAAGIFLFVLPFPLLALGAYCLDLLEKKRPAPRLPAEPRPTGEASPTNWVRS